MHDVAVGDHIILAFQPHFAGVARACLAAAGDVILIGNGLRSDEATLEIGMNHTRRLWRPGPLSDGPGPRLFWSDREISYQMQKLVTGANQPIKPGFL